MIECIDLKCENLINPIGIDEVNPRFSWKLTSDKEEVFQTGYEIIVEDMWHAVVKSEQSLYIKYDGAPLQPKTKYNYKVRVTDNYGETSPFISGSFTTGMMGEKIQAKWIGRFDGNSEKYAFVKNIVCGEFDTAYIFASAYGLYEIYINGKRVGDSWFSPGFTSYNNRLQYQMYDVSEYLTGGENEIKVYLGNGWCSGRYPFQTWKKVYKELPAFMLQLELDGDIKCVTDSGWQSINSPIIKSEFYDGETYDSRIENDSFDKEGVDVFDYASDNLVWNAGEKVRVIEEIRPVKMFKTPKGETVIDFGQNMVGWAEFSGTGKCGDVLSFTHAEVLDKDGNFYTENLRTAKNEVTFILNGNENQAYHPHFSFQGFRYIRIDECSFDVGIENFSGKVISSINTTSKFHSANELLNKLFLNVQWGQKGNFVDIPTDCPQRDERVGWTGDAQVFMSTALKNADCFAFFNKWLRDMMADQTEEGLAQIFIPAMIEEKTASAWGDCAAICPWELYKAGADKDFLEVVYPMMKKWVNYIKAQGDNEYLWNTGFQFGDWLGLDAEEGSYEGATDKFYIATAYYAYSTALTLKAAKVLGKYDDAEVLLNLYRNIKKEFLKVYTDSDGMPVCKTQTAYALGLFMDLFENKPKAAKELSDMIKNNGNKLTTGFVGTPYLCFALSENGQADTAYSILLQEEYPSWLYSVKQGATTVWEHWDGLKPDGTMWSEDMNSFNHYAYGSIMDWVYSVVCGISTDEELGAYKRSVIAPKPDKRLQSCFTEFDTPYGKIASGWEYTDGNKLKVTVKIPCNTVSKIILPDGKTYEKGSGEYTWEI